MDAAEQTTHEPRFSRVKTKCAGSCGMSFVCGGNPAVGDVRRGGGGDGGGGGGRRRRRRRHHHGKASTRRSIHTFFEDNHQSTMAPRDEP